MDSFLVWISRFIKGKMMRHMPNMITCVEFEEFIIDYLEGTLSQTDQLKFEKHIRFCRECREYLTAYQHSIELGRIAFKLPDDPVPEDVPEDLVKAILEVTRR